MLTRNKYLLQSFERFLIFFLTVFAILFIFTIRKHTFPSENELFHIVEGYSGINIHFIQPNEQEVAELTTCGFNTVRMDLLWDQVEKEKGIYDFSQYDKLVENMSVKDICILFILDYGNKLYDGGMAPFTEDGRAAFAKFAEVCAERYKNRKIIWEIWNEPNSKFWKPNPNVEAYCKLTGYVIQRVRRADPKALIIAPASSTFPWEFITTLGEMSILTELDAISVHPYRDSNPETVSTDYAKLRELLSKYSPRRRIPIISGEWGYSTTTQGIDEYKQAQYLVRSHLVNIANNIPLSIWYDWRDDGTDPNNKEHNFGVVHEDLSHKPAYIAAQTLMHTIDGYRFERRIETGDKDNYLLLFKNGRKKLLAVWTTKEEHEIPIPLSKGKVQMIEMYGTKSEVNIPQAGLQLYISQSPQYLLFEGKIK